MKRYTNTVKSLLEISNKKFGIVVQMFISCGIYNLSSLLPPIATSGIIAVITDNNFSGIWYYVMLYIIFYILYFSALHWNYYTYTVLGEYYHLNVQKILFEHVANNDSIFNEISKGKIVDTCSDDVRYLVDVLNSASQALIHMLELIVIFLIFSYYNILVAVLVLALDLLYLKYMNDNSRRVSKYYEGTRKYEDKIIDILNQMLMNIKQIKALNIMPSLNKKLDKTRNRWISQYHKKRKKITTRYCVIPYIVYIGKIILYIFLAYLVVCGRMTIDKLVLLISYFELTVKCTDEMLEHLLNLSNYGIRVKRIKNILDYSAFTNINYGDVDNDYINGTIVFDDVNYEIGNNRILNHVSFKVYPNEITAIIGHSGSGKTTIANLLYRLDRVKSGSILIDNENIYNYSKKSYSSNISGVFQKTFIFEMSIRDNLSLIDSDRQNQIKACKRVGIHKLIESLPKGYNTVIKEDEYILSEGQRQLLAIARAILTGCEILLFDEVTSNIDPSTTTVVANVLEDLKIDHTIIMITHKPEMMSIADRVIVMDKGKVVAKGKNEKVLKTCALYQELKNRTFASVSKHE